MPRVIRSALFIVSLLLVALPLVSCGNGTGPSAMGEATLILTDADVVSAAIAPALAAAVDPAGDVPAEAISGIELVLTRVDLHLTGGAGEEIEQNEEQTEEGDDGDSGWQSLTLTEGGTIDLVNLPESSGFQIANGELPAGRYNNLRLFYSSATLRLGEAITIRGAEIPAGDYDLRIPSGDQTGLKVPLSAFDVDAGELETLIVEVLSNASVASIRWNANGFRMSPVLKQR